MHEENYKIIYQNQNQITDKICDIHQSLNLLNETLNNHRIAIDNLLKEKNRKEAAFFNIRISIIIIVLISIGASGIYQILSWIYS